MIEVVFGLVLGLAFAIFFPEPFSKIKAKVIALTRKAKDGE